MIRYCPDTVFFSIDNYHLMLTLNVITHKCGTNDSDARPRLRIFNLLVQASTLADNVLGSAAPVAILMPHGRSTKVIGSNDRIIK